MEEQRNFFQAVNTKTSFWLGFAGGIGVMFIIGFFVMLGLYTSGKDIGIVAGAALNTNQQVAVNNNANPSAAQPTTGTPPEVKTGDHIKGAKNAPVTLIEFSDFQCPYCEKFEPAVTQLLKEYPDKVRVVYKHFPLDSLHPQARPAAEASECVAHQLGDDAFFKFAQAMFDNQSALGRDLYISEAVKLGANKTKITTCIDSRQYKDDVTNDYNDGVAAGVRGTPTSYINGRQIAGALPYEQVKAVVDSVLNQ